MPKKINTKKSASAQFASIKAIQRAAAGESSVLFASVQGAKGKGYTNEELVASGVASETMLARNEVAPR